SVAALQAKIKSLNKKLRTANTLATQYQHRMLDARSDLAQANVDLAHARKDAKDANTTVTSLRADNTSLTAPITTLNGQILNLEGQVLRPICIDGGAISVMTPQPVMAEILPGGRHALPV